MKTPEGDETVKHYVLLKLAAGVDRQAAFKRVEETYGALEKELPYLHHAQDIHEADIEFQKRVRAMYLRQAEVDNGLQLVDCSDEAGEMLPPDDIFAKIKALVDSRL